MARVVELLAEKAKYYDEPTLEFYPPELWPKKHYAIPSMSNYHYYLSNYHVNDKIICWGVVIEEQKKQ